MQLTVGFDLDMTLVDTRPGICAADCLALPGAVDAAAAVRAAGGRVVVVTAKKASLAQITLAAAGIEADAVHGWLSGAEKGEALLAEGATVYVGDLTAFPTWFADHLLDVRLALLDTRLRELGSLLVAFSGGADSAFLLAAAIRALGAGKVVAATAVSPSLAQAELPAAAAYAASLGVRHMTPTTDELSREGYVANAGDRCFHCKATLLDTLRPLASELGLAHVATGTNADDAVAGFRPGIRAAAERGAATPLLDAGLTKAQVREASRRWGLRTADKPALACLASRIAYGIEVTPSRLARVDAAETALRVHLGDGVTDLRVRDLGSGTARVELDAAALAACDENALAVVRRAGFDDVSAAPYRTGSLNDALLAADR